MLCILFERFRFVMYHLESPKCLTITKTCVIILTMFGVFSIFMFYMIYLCIRVFDL